MKLFVITVRAPNWYSQHTIKARHMVEAFNIYIRKYPLRPNINNITIREI